MAYSSPPKNATVAGVYDSWEICSVAGSMRLLSSSLVIKLETPLPGVPANWQPTRRKAPLSPQCLQLPVLWRSACRTPRKHFGPGQSPASRVWAGSAPITGRLAPVVQPPENKWADRNGQVAQRQRGVAYGFRHRASTIAWPCGEPAVRCILEHKIGLYGSYYGGYALSIK